MNLYNTYRRIKYSNLGTFRLFTSLKDSFECAVQIPKQVQILLNCGPPRSGTTLIDVVLRQLVHMKSEQTLEYASSPCELKSIVGKQRTQVVVKTHRYFPFSDAGIQQGNIKPILMHRNIKDIAASLKDRGWIEDIEKECERRFFRHLSLSTLAYAMHNQTTILRYDDISENPEKIINNLAGVVDISLSLLERKSLMMDYFSTTTTAVPNSSPLQLEGKKWDPITGFHPNHIQNPKSGKWREQLTDNEANLIDMQCLEYNKFFGYDR